MRIGFLGGRFDPVHFGHLGAAQTAAEALRLDRVVFVPAARVPHLSTEARAPAAHRLAMLRLAIEAQPLFAMSDHELAQDGPAYTVDTVRHFRRVHPQDDLFWIVGDDQLARLPRWRGIGELAAAIEFISVVRPGPAAPPSAAIPGLRLHRCTGRPVATSSTELRDNVRRGQSLAALTPPAVAAYIARHGLYRENDTAPRPFA